ncbi:MAG: plasmid recombination protein [Gordonia sp. (in: high G+C Gram-positive bacteria)]|uniref:plasmid recombination protein n=1 Tax=Gordonia sp. (in: high G+C Gram-positive bacteria) TaxID=84139 RepID=UPI003C7831A0
MTQTSLGPVVGSNRTARGAVARTGGSSGWSTSARWEGCTKATATPRINHILRDVEEQNGLYRKHSNELIDGSKTKANFSFRFATAADGTITKERITDVATVFAHLEAGLTQAQRYRTIPEVRRVKVLDENGQPIPLLDDAGEPVLDKKGKPQYEREEVPMPNAGEKVPIALGKDTVVAVEELFQLDPEWTGPIKDMTPDRRKEIQRLYDIWYADLVDQYGAQNILCISEHWDETSPHVSAFAMPLADRGDGTAELNVKLFTTGKKKPTRTEARAAYTTKHDRLRAALQSAGYEATFERITPRDSKGFAGKGAPLDNFKRAAARATAEREIALDERQATLGKREADLTARETGVRGTEKAAKRKLDDATAAYESAHVDAYVEFQEKYEDLVDELEKQTRQKQSQLTEDWNRRVKPGLVKAARAEGREAARVALRDEQDRARAATTAAEAALHRARERERDADEKFETADQEVRRYKRQAMSMIDGQVAAATGDIQAMLAVAKSGLPEIQPFDEEAMLAGQSGAYVTAAKRWKLKDGETIHDKLMMQARTIWERTVTNGRLKAGETFETYFGQTVREIQERSAQLAKELQSNAEPVGSSRDWESDYKP